MVRLARLLAVGAATLVCESAGYAAAPVPPLDSRLSSYVIFAQRAAHLTSLNVPTGSIGVNCPQPSPNSGCGRLLLPPGATTGDGTQVVAASVDVGRNSNLYQVFTGALTGKLSSLLIRDPGDRPDGTSLYGGPLLPDLDGDGNPSCDDQCVADVDDLAVACGFKAAFPDPRPSCNVANPVFIRPGVDCIALPDADLGNGRCDLPPGVYGDVVILNGGIVAFTGGTYVFCRLATGTDVVVRALAPATIDIAGDLQMDSRSRLGDAVGDIGLFVDGIGDLQFGNNVTINGRICAPERQVFFGDHGITVNGQVIADSVIGDPFGGKPTPCHDAADCNQGVTCGPRTCVDCPAALCRISWDPACCNVIGDSFCAAVGTPPETPCDDGDVCTVGDTCGPSNACTPAGPRDCDDGNPCTVDSCDPAAGGDGCVHAPSSSACDDGDACTSGDVCVADAQVGAVCRGTSVPDCPLTPPGECADDGDCLDANPCNGVEHCDAGTCRPGTPVVCTAGGPCRQPGTCDPASSACSSPPVSDGTPCPDDDPCTVGAETCEGGICLQSRRCNVDLEAVTVGDGLVTVHCAAAGDDGGHRKATCRAVAREVVGVVARRTVTRKVTAPLQGAGGAVLALRLNPRGRRLRATGRLHDVEVVVKLRDRLHRSLVVQRRLTL